MTRTVLASFITLLLAWTFCCAPHAHAQQVYSDNSSVVPGRVIAAGDVVRNTVEGTNLGTFQQTVAIALGGDHASETISMTNDFAPLRVGDRIFVRITLDGEDTYYSVYDIDRGRTLLVLTLLFVVAVIAFGGRKGVRSLLALLLSIAIIFFVLMPLVAAGHSPVIWGVLIALALLASVMTMTHGINSKTIAAFLGTSIAVVITGVITYIAVRSAMFTGMGNEESFSLLITGSKIDMAQLLLAGIIIGMVGVLDDVAITQAAVVMELKRAGIRGRAVFSRAMIVGREHVGALINTLILAYAGASLPLFLLLATYHEPLPALLNIEMVATEIARSLLGSIGIILAVPLTTLLTTALTTSDDEDDGAYTHMH